MLVDNDFISLHCESQIKHLCRTELAHGLHPLPLHCFLTTGLCGRRLLECSAHETLGDVWWFGASLSDSFI